MKLLLGFPVCMILLFSFQLKAQPKQFPDSIRVEVPDHQSIIIFEMRRFSDDKSIIKDFPSYLTTLLEQVAKGIPESNLTKPHKIEVRTIMSREREGELEIRINKPDTEVTDITVSKGDIIQLLPPGWEIHITSAKAEISVYAPDYERLRQLATVSLEPVIAHLEKDPVSSSVQRKGFLSRVILNNGVVNPVTSRLRLPADMLGLHAGAGVGILQDKLYPEFNFMTAFYFSNRFKENHQRIALNYELKFFSGRNAEGGYRSMPATFLSMSYGLNFSKERARWTALGVGYLVHNKSDIFTGKTMKIFIETDIGSAKLNIVPELYLTEDLKKTLFGVKLNYKF